MADDETTTPDEAPPVTDAPPTAMNLRLDGARQPRATAATSTRSSSGTSSRLFGECRVRTPSNRSRSSPP